MLFSSSVSSFVRKTSLNCKDVRTYNIHSCDTLVVMSKEYKYSYNTPIQGRYMFRDANDLTR